MSILEINRDRYFRCTNFYIAVFLFAKGLELVNIEQQTESKRAQFVFRDAHDRKDLVESFNFSKEDAPDVMIDARKFVTAIKTLKDKLYSDRF